MSRFKVGDKVRVRKDLKPNEWYGRVTFTLKMKKYFGGIETTIENVYCDGGYLLTGCEDYVFTDEMLKPVEEIKIGDTVEIIEGKLKGVKGEIIAMDKEEIKIGNDPCIFNAICQFEVKNNDIIINGKVVNTFIADLDNIKLISKAKQEGVYIGLSHEECKYILDGDRTTIILPSGVKGQVKLYKDDEYDKDLGMNLAYHKAKFKEIVKEINKKC